MNFTGTTMKFESDQFWSQFCILGLLVSYLFMIARSASIAVIFYCFISLSFFWISLAGLLLSFVTHNLFLYIHWTLIGCPWLFAAQALWSLCSRVRFPLTWPDSLSRTKSLIFFLCSYLSFFVHVGFWSLWSGFLSVFFIQVQAKKFVRWTVHFLID